MAAFITAASASAQAADLPARYGYRGAPHRIYHHYAPRDCPDFYSCRPLYGAYGPYGGRAYWTAYTSGGWTSYGGEPVIRARY
jgi:hypothetical protein